jgi:hypothetical protein
MSTQTLIRSFATHHYGNLISSEKPQFDDRTKTWIAQIRSDYPIVLQDDREPEKKIISFIPINRIGKILFDENLRFCEKESTSIDDCAKAVQSILEMWRDRAERIVVQASADHLVLIPEFRHFFIPIEEVVDSILEHDEVCDNELIKNRPLEKQNKAMKYVKLLEGLELIQRIDNRYEAGKLFVFLREECDNKNLGEDDFKRAILSEVVRKRYSSLRDVFEISRFQPTIHINSCIYKPSLEAESLIYMTEKSIVSNYRELYGRINPCSLTHILRRLKNVDAVDRNGQYWSGTKELLEEMMNIKSQMPELAPPTMTH